MFSRDRSWFERHPLFVAYDLIGALLRVERDGMTASGRVVEVEAYAGPDDLASHTGKYTSGRVSLFGEQGQLYVHRSYGIHTLVNVVAHRAGEAGGVLFRALEPLSGMEGMQLRRGDRARRLASGPGSLSQAMDFRMDDNGVDLLTAPWVSVEVSTRQDSVLAGPRIGVSKGLSANWRLFDRASRHVSVHRRGTLVTHDDLRHMIPSIGTIIS